MLSYRKDIRAAVEGANFAELERLVAGDRTTVRHLVGLTYAADARVAEAAARGLALAARHHPDLVLRAMRRLVWAMNDESGGNALDAPRVFETVAKEEPELLLPLVPELNRLREDEGLRDGLERALRAIAKGCPRKVPRWLGEELSRPEPGEER